MAHIQNMQHKIQMNSESNSDMSNNLLHKHLQSPKQKNKIKLSVIVLMTDEMLTPESSFH